MPLYEYECQKCHTRVERIEKLSGPYLKVCPKCKGKMERLISSPSIQFKGSGWYVTDYARSGSGGNGGDSDKSESKKSDATAAAAEKSAASGGEDKSKSKPAPATKGKKTGTTDK